MKPQFGEFDFTPPCFQGYLDSIDPEFRDNIRQMFIEAFLKLCCSEKLMIRPFIELKQLKIKHAQSHGAQKQELVKQIKARLCVMNENGDIQVLVKRFNIILLDLSRKKSFKTIAKMGADSLLSFIYELKEAGELR